MDKTFSQWKKQCLNKLDLSKKGSVDEDIQPIVSLLNSCEEYFTTSSCSGRIILIDGVREALFGTGLWGRVLCLHIVPNKLTTGSSQCLKAFYQKRTYSCVVYSFGMKKNLIVQNDFSYSYHNVLPSIRYIGNGVVVKILSCLVSSTPGSREKWCPETELCLAVCLPSEMQIGWPGDVWRTSVLVVFHLIMWMWY